MWLCEYFLVIALALLIDGRERLRLYAYKQITPLNTTTTSLRQNVEAGLSDALKWSEARCCRRNL